jgi:hypothetical protein
MEHYIDMELGELKQKLLTMASHAETAVNEALRALVERDYDLALGSRRQPRRHQFKSTSTDGHSTHSPKPARQRPPLCHRRHENSQNLERRR